MQDVAYEQQQKMSIEPARPEDVAAMCALMAQHQLPTEGVAALVETAVVSRWGKTLNGMAAVEDYGMTGLLRSVAVAPSFQGTGLGRVLVDAALAEAVARGIQEVYLLTTTAVAIFEHLGFQQVPRDSITGPVRQSEEFSTLCPASAVVMHKELL